MNFKNWLHNGEMNVQEVGTSTGDVAGFKRIVMGHVRRTSPPFIVMPEEDDPWWQSWKKIERQNKS